MAGKLRNTVFLLCVLTVGNLSAQEYKSTVREGNERYAEEDYEGAADAYRKALDENEDGIEARFNLGNALMRAGKSEEALDIFRGIGSGENVDKEIRSRAWHNAGNGLMEGNNYGEAAEAYKNALRLNPGDDETRYNYARALEKLKEQQEQDGKDQEDKEEEQDQEQDNDEGQNDKSEENEENKDPSGDEGDGQPEQDEPEQGEGGEQERAMDRMQMERLLEALEREEEEIQDKMKRKKMKGEPVKSDKDW